MTRSPSALTLRRTRAEAALARLPGPVGDHVVLAVQCRSAHHLATVYRTDAGLVYRTRTRRHSHGARDRVDTGHHGHSAGSPWTDLLDPAETVATAEPLPAWCECGPRILPRDQLLAAITEGVGRLIMP